ncbi:DUF6240 domain-containing protein [Butyrivibrio sp. WCD3002]|uniref:DUF6240 domain-containing protein n=1 Tax=Butyrivibrio sp. WCD3002 TaxID=1280676 RepID=UPI0012DF1482|nr:DUF6240 domain-containing protein [Butyrivibrio sp. WCD3002]
MNISINALSGTESDFDKKAVSMEAGFQFNNQKVTKSQSAAVVDLGSSLFSNDAYGEGTKTQNDIMAQAQNTEMSIRHNYMSVMANTLSPEDYAKAAEEGFDFSQTSSDETVTILDKIKAVLAQSGEEIIGYTDDLSAGELKKITGSEGLANQIVSTFHKNDIPVTKENVKEVTETVRQMSEIDSLSEGAVKFMVTNNLTATMDNIYMAEHATNGQNAKSRGLIALEAGGYYAQKADKIEWDSLRDQAARIIEEAGLETTPENEKLAKWMVEQSIPLTTDNLKKADELSNIKLPMSVEAIVDSAVKSIANKNTAAAGTVTGEENHLEKAVAINKKTRLITDVDIEEAVKRGEKINLKTLFDVHEEKGQQSQISEPVKNQDVNFLTARKQLEEVRLSMSVTANLRLIDKGFSIDTAPMEELITSLNNEIEEIGKSIFGSTPDITGKECAEKLRLFDTTENKLNEFRTYPLALVGRIDPEKNDSLDAIIESGYRLKLRYEKAGATYEAVGTQVRADLGDNIKKAFRNVDDILTDLKEDLNDENRRVVRILGYNRMEISPENIEKVRTVDEKLINAIDKLKPQAVLNMIREGKNPLNMTLDELSNNLSDGDKDRSGREEKYAKFLYKLEKNAEISPEEKESYIGIYRLFHTLKKTDNAAIGTVLETGAPMTLENLLSATRTLKAEKRGLDYKLDENFSGIDAGERITKAIDSQIETAFLYYSEKADIVYQNLDPEKLNKAKPKEDTLLDKLADELAMTQEDSAAIETEKAYYSEESRRIRAIVDMADDTDVAEELIRNEIEVNVSNLEALINLRAGRRGRNGLFNQAERISDLSFKEKEAEILDELAGGIEFKQFYEEQLEELSESLDDMLTQESGTASFIDVKAIQLMQKQITVAVKMADRGSFEIPVEVDGRTVSMHVTLKDSDNEGSKMEASVESGFYGRISMAVTIENGELKGAFASSLTQSEDVIEYMTELRSRFVKEADLPDSELDIKESNISIMYHRSEAGSVVRGAEKGFSDNRQLLRMAAIFVHAL